MSAARDGGLEIPPELQRELRELSAREGRISHYELLGIAADADSGAVRRAFLERSRKFHPDAWYRKELGEFAPLLTRAFQRINTAYQVLSDPDARVAYDTENASAFTSSDRAKILQRGQVLADEERRQREGRDRLLRMKGFARIGAARQLYEQAIKHAAEGNRTAALAELATARELDPMRKEIALKIAELEKESAKVRIATAITWGKDLEAQGSHDKAKSIFANAFQQDGTAGEAAFGAARCALELSDWQQAATWGQRAAELLPLDLDARMVAARAFAKLKMKARAKAELTFVLQKQPNHPEAKALLKGL